PTRYARDVTCAPPPPSESEPNDDAATANALGCADRLRASIDPVGDVDWFRIDLPSAASLSARTLECTGDTTLALHDADLTMLDFDDDDGGGFCSLLTDVLLPGTYYLEVRERGNDARLSYSIEATCGPATPAESEPNGSFETANGIACSNEVYGAITPASDIDFWAFQLSVDSLATVEVECTGDSALP